MPKTLLLEAKNIRGHVSSRSPWASHSKLKAISAVINPGRQIKQQLIGKAQASKSFPALEIAFKTELTGVFSKIKDGEEASTKEAASIFRKNYHLAFRMGKKSGGAVSTGLPLLSSEDTRWLETFIRKELGYWKKFASDVRGKLGKLPYDRRLDMYVQTLRGVYQSGIFVESPPNTVFDWVTSPVEHCPHCLYLARKSPFTKKNIPTIPGTGDTVCKSNCKCKLKSRLVSPLEYRRISSSSPTRESLIREMKALSK